MPDSVSSLPPVIDFDPIPISLIVNHVLKEKAIQSIAKRYKEASPETTPLLASDIIALITRLVLFTRSAASPKKQVSQSKIALARNWLLEHAFEDVQPARICEVTGMGYSAFRKAFKDETGYAPHTYVLEIRLSRAKALLQQTDLTVTQVAAQTGFSSVFYFTRSFARQTGCPPGLWRETKGADSALVQGRKQARRAARHEQAEE